MAHSNELRFDGQVALVTGAGGGLGKAYALLFGSRGAKVVVNDLGGSASGEGSDARPADIVVDEIRSKGGIAVADYNSVEDGTKVVQTALDNFGRIDIVVNNAGILRDRSFARISDTDWDLIHRVHLRGSFMVTRAAWPHMRAQKYGRIIMTSSTAGLLGNFGQANYSAAKMGLVGLTNTLSIEGTKYNIHCNTLVPMSGTRLTHGLMTDELFESLTPELIAPLVLWLCHQECPDTGGIYAGAGGWFGEYRLLRSQGFTCRRLLSEQVLPEAVRDNWHKITDFADASELSGIQEDGARLAMVLEELKENEEKLKHAPVQSPSSAGQLAALGRVSINSFSYDSLEVILYALGVGASTKDHDGLKFLYEGHENFSVLPTFAVIPILRALMNGSMFTNIPGWNIDLTKLLHGEQYLELVKPIPTSGKLNSKMTVVDVLDKGSGALILINGELTDEDNNLIGKSQMSTFIVGDGNFGGPRNSSKQVSLVKRPERNPDAIEIFKTSVDQAALYRLSGDRNPLHISPDFAAMGGFSEPILHGLCSYGYSARAVLKRYCNNDVSKFKAIMGRFSKPVIPGQTLEIMMWKEGSRIFYETRVKENAKVCITGGYVDITGDISASGISFENRNMKTSKFFKGAAANIQSRPYKGPQMLILWNILDEDDVGAQWTFDFRDPPGSIYLGAPNGISATGSITVRDNDLMDIFNGDCKPSDAFLTGKLKLAGNIMNMNKLMELFIPQSNL